MTNQEEFYKLKIQLHERTGNFILVIFGFLVLVLSFIFQLFLNPSASIYTVLWLLVMIARIIGVILILWAIISYPLTYYRTKKLKKEINQKDTSELVRYLTSPIGSGLYDLEALNAKKIISENLDERSWKPNTPEEKIWYQIANKQFNQLFIGNSSFLPNLIIILGNNELPLYGSNNRKNIEILGNRANMGLSVIIQTLNETNVKYPYNLILILGEIGSTDSTDTILHYINDSIENSHPKPPNTRVDVTEYNKTMIASALAFKKIKDKQAIGSLIKMLSIKVFGDYPGEVIDYSPHAAASYALSEIGFPAIDPLIKIIKSDSPVILKSTVAITLINIGKPAIEQVKMALSQEKNQGNSKTFEYVINKINEGKKMTFIKT